MFVHIYICACVCVCVSVCVSCLIYIYIYIFNRFGFSFLSSRSVAIPRLKILMNDGIHTFPNGISAMGNAHSLVLDLNSWHRVHFHYPENNINLISIFNFYFALQLFTIYMWAHARARVEYNECRSKSCKSHSDLLSHISYLCIGLTRTKINTGIWISFSNSIRSGMGYGDFCLVGYSSC